MDINAVRRAIRSELEGLGYSVATDSHGLRAGMYLLGAGDLARALIEFSQTAAEACDTMYQGSWVAGLPPRFVVLPETGDAAADMEMLEQMRVTPIFCTVGACGPEFPDLAAILERHVGV